MESFYGGRSGISFTIVNHFDSVKDMLDAFSKGGDYGEVNYGEYVIVDTIVNLNKKSSLENGLVYTRGYNYSEPYAEVPDSNNYIDSVTGNFNENAYELAMRNYFSAPGAGAVYIGQIVGPQGESPELTIATESEVKNLDKAITLTGTLDVQNGKDQNVVSYAYATIRDSQGNVTGCTLGFTIPYHVFEFNASSVSAYDSRYGTYDSDSKTWTYKNLITKSLGNDDEHPYYSVWQIQVPKGIHGEDFYELGVDPDSYQYFYRLKDYNASESGDVTKYWLDNIYHKVINSITLDITEPSNENAKDGRSNLIITYTTKNSLGQNEQDILPVSLLYDIVIDEDTKELKVLYTDYDENGEHKSKFIGEKFKIIDYIKMNNDNKLEIFYTTKDENGQVESEVVGDAFKFINEIKIDENTKIMTITYKIGKDEAGKDIISDPIELGDPINYVDEIAVDPDNYHLLIYFSSSVYRSKMSKKYSYNGKTDWYDLGCVRGEAGGIHIIGDVDSIDKLPAGGASGDYKGWVYTVTATVNGVETTEIYAYDYIGSKGWYSIGSLDSNAIKPTSMVLMQPANDQNEPQTGGENLNIGGLWFVVETN